MIRNYFITAFRNIQRNFGYFFINLFGLSIGIISCLIIFLIVKNELGYDSYHKKANRTYRVTLGGRDFNPTSSMAVLPALRIDFPELEESCQIMLEESGIIKIGTNRFEEKIYAYAENSFFNIFDHQWISGNSQNALSEPNTVILTESTAKKYFGDKDPIGQIFNLQNKYDLKVTGVIKDAPANTHLKFNFLVSFETIKKSMAQDMVNYYDIINGAQSYIVIPKNYAIKTLEAQLPKFIAKHWGNDIAKEAVLIMQPLKDIHFDQRYLYSPFSSTTSKEIYWTLAAVAFIIIIMACINFINLSTAQSVKRAKEVGIRKVLGGNRIQLLFQFLSETGLIVLIAVSISLFVSQWLIPEVGNWLNINISMDQLKEPLIIAWMSLIIFSIILLAGLYPAFIQSAFNPVDSFKNKSKISLGGLSLRKSLVLAQFCISQILIVATFVVARQMNFLQNQDLGFNKEAVISLYIPDMEKNELIRQKLINNPGIKEVSFSSAAPAYNHSFAPFHAIELGVIKDEVTEFKFIDEKYTDMFELKMLAGEKVNKNDQKDTTNPVVVNETLMHALGIQNPSLAIGKRIVVYGGTNAIIKGVVRDFQSESKHKLRRPCILFYMPKQFFMVNVKLNPKGKHETIARIENDWANLFPDEFFKYEFLDEHIAASYRQEEREYTAFKLFSCIAVIIGCLGLYGLIAFSSMQRTKEIGIRKILGASISQIVKLLSKDFLILLLLASFIAFPLSWYFMNKWLQNFAYHISINVEIFVVAGLASLVIVLITISQQAIKAAIANPVKSLRAE